jgi:Oxidoreductase FAD-binding domain/Oxidoreductase NAD-binding domain
MRFRLLFLVWQVYPEGRMSQHLDKMVLGDCILAKGPKGRFTYTRNMKRHIGAHLLSCCARIMVTRQPCCAIQNFPLRPRPWADWHLLAAGMVAGGTGITPMWQVADHILRDGIAEKTSVRRPQRTSGSPPMHCPVSTGSTLTPGRACLVMVQVQGGCSSRR